MVIQLSFHHGIDDINSGIPDAKAKFADFNSPFVTGKP